ncbi:MAG: phosphoenolpyruvate--protein phosphotransferase [Chloroflexi bacterium]|nr:phosphoenolpyruvate--protein phosphotransferase [Chloroflexota bacterium]
MIGFVLVSHSAKIAEGARELAEQMTQGRVAIAAAGGIDDPAHPIGTDPMKIVAAIEAVYSDDGVIVLMDLGSALMSAETALEFIEPERAERVHLCSAPLVEGIVAAAVQATAGGTVDQAMAEAQSALEAKRAHLNEAAMLPPAQDEPITSDATHTLRVIIPNALGLHARPAAKLVALTGQYQANLTLRVGDRTVNARSINQIATLGARQGDELIAAAVGPDAVDLLAAVQRLADDNFGDPLDLPAAPSADGQIERHDGVPDHVIVGIGASPGIAIGVVQRLEDERLAIPERNVADSLAEAARFDAAVATAVADLRQLETTTRQRIGGERAGDQAGIFEAHRLILEDPELIARVTEAITATSQNAESIWWAQVQALADRYRALPDPYLSGRAADVIDVGKRVLRHLLPGQTRGLRFDQPCILVAADLSPSDTAQLDSAQVLGIITVAGGATGHTAILARALGIPAVVGAGPAVQRIEAGQQIALDGGSGWIWTTLSDDERQTLAAQRADWLEAQQQLRQRAHEPAITRDGLRIEVAANIGQPDDARQGAAAGAEGVGLFRTELLFMGRESAPTEDEQYQAYCEAASHLSGGPLIVRILDVGADKPIDYLPVAAEANPFLGYRGVRNWLDAPAIARAQLRAICRASAEHNLKIMFPMVSTIAELRDVRERLRAIQAELSAEEIAHNPDLEVGVMIEVPAAVLMADQLAPLVDFFSIGTNDLAQYIMAADRGNPAVNHLADYCQPAVLRAIRLVTKAADDAGIWVGMCGEMAGDPLAVPLLVGMGITELSMNAPAIPAVKAVIRTLDRSACQALVDQALALESPEAVRTLLESRASEQISG